MTTMAAPGPPEHFTDATAGVGVGVGSVSVEVGVGVGSDCLAGVALGAGEI
jgi:hypothetical protein